MNFRGKAYGAIPWRILTFTENLYGPISLNIRQKFPPRPALVHAWLFPDGSSLDVVPESDSCRRKTFYTIEKMDYILNSRKHFYVTYVMHYMIITYSYSLKIFLCQGGLC